MPAIVPRVLRPAPSSAESAPAGPLERARFDAEMT